MESADTTASSPVGKVAGGEVGDLEGDVLVVGEARAGAVQHGRGDVHEMDVRGGVPLAHEGREQAGAGADVENARGARGDEVGGAAVEGVIAGDELGAVGVVGGGGDVEGGLGCGGHEYSLLSGYCLACDRATLRRARWCCRRCGWQQQGAGARRRWRAAGRSCRSARRRRRRERSRRGRSLSSARPGCRAG
jgi:hypothetical protein